MQGRDLKVTLFILISIILLALSSTLLLDFISRLNLIEYIKYIKRPAITLGRIFNTTLILTPGEQRIINITLKNNTKINSPSDCNIIISIEPSNYEKCFKTKILNFERRGKDVKLSLKVEVDKKCSSCRGTVSIESLDSSEKYACLYINVVSERKSYIRDESRKSKCLSIPHSITLSPKPIFYVSGATHTSYLRISVFSRYVYNDNTWILDNDEEKIPYTSLDIVNDIPILYPNYVVDRITIVFIDPSSAMPTSKYTRVLKVLEGDIERIDYYPNLIAFQIMGEVKEYYFETIHFKYDTEFMNSLDVVKIKEYLQVPEELQDLKKLALEITRGYDTPYEKARAIEKFLKTNYKYNINFTIPKDENPIRYFLLKGKEGICIHFNSAFVILARLVGLPARLVSGFLIYSSETDQVVYSDQKHVWSEVLFEKVGWIRFDATVGGRGFCPHCRGGEICKICIEDSEEVRDKETSKERVEGLSKQFKLVADRNTLSLERGLTKVIGVCAECYGYNSKIKLSVIYDERNFEVNINPQIIDNSTKSHISITCKRDAVPGKYKIVVEGTNEEGRKASVTITVIIEGYFTITFEELIKVIRGSRITVNGSVEPRGPYPYSVMLRIEGLPSDAQHVIKPNSGIPPFIFYTTFYASKYTKVGDYDAKLIGIGSNDKKYSVTFTLRILGKSEITISSFKPTRVIKGQWVIVKGILRSELGESLPNRTIVVYLKESKESDELVKIGEGITDNKGIFTINCTIPTNIDVGEYLIIAEFPGDDYYLGSITDPKLIVVDRPVIYIVKGIPLITFANAKYLIVGKVCDSNGKPLSNVSVVIFVNQHSLLVNTSEKGLFEANMNLDIGINIINITTPKLKYYEPSYRVLKTYTILVNLSSRTWIRGERVKIHGFIKGLKYLNLNRVMICLENLTKKLFEVFLKVSNETFEYSYYVNKSTSVGHYILSCKLPLRGINYTVTKRSIIIMAKVKILEDIPVEVHKEDEFNIAFRLVDCYFEDLVLQGVNASVEIIDRENNMILDRGIISNKTGFITLKYRVPKSYNYTEIKVRLTINDPFCLPTTKVYTIKIKERELSWIVLIPIVTGLIAISSILAYIVYRKKATKKVTKVFTEEETEYEHVEIIGDERVIKKIRIKLSFPQIREPFPLTWSINEPLKVVATAYEDNKQIPSDFEFYINDLRVSKGREIIYTFKEKGIYRIKAVLRVNDSVYEKTRNIKIVEYREEVIELYNRYFLKWVKELGIEVLKRTPEEIMYDVIDKTEEKDELIEKITSIFEEAKYSTHEIGRKHYEEFYMVLYNLKIL